MAEPHYAFGAFELFPERRLLLEAGTPLKLGPRAFDLLAVLVERGGEIVSNSELLRKVWPHANVEDVALRVHLSTLRKTLQSGNGGKSPISNITGRGYTLTIPVEERGTGQEPPVTVQVNHDRLDSPLVGRRLIGREATVSALCERLSTVRFLTLAGPGGIGKTSVAQSMADVLAGEYSEGVAFVDLATLVDPKLLWSAIAAATQVATVTEEVSKTVVAALRGRHVLVILDNCEHLVEEAAAAAQMLWREIPTLSVLATSREPLRADAEHVHQLTPLECPADEDDVPADDIGKYSALTLLVERTRASRDNFALTDDDVPIASSLCKKLDGLPLAIELVAPGVATFGLRTVVNNIEDRNAAILKGPRTATPRHQTLAAALDWSFDVLTDTERMVLKRLGVFQAGVDFSTASAFLASAEMKSEDILESMFALHTKSLLAIERVHDGEVQYRLLETTKLYVVGKLKTEGQYDEVSRRHAEFYCDYFASAESDWNDLSQRDWRLRYARTLAEVRAAINWAMSTDGRAALAASLLTRTGPLWTELGLVAEYRDRLDELLRKLERSPEVAAELAIRAKLEWAKSTWITHGPTPGLVEVARQALRLAEEMDNSVDVVEALWLLWNHRALSGNGDEGLFQKAFRLAENSPDPVVQLSALRLIAIDLHYDGAQLQAWEYQTRMDGYSDQTFRRIRRICHRGDQVLGHSTLASRLLWLRGFPDQALETVMRGVDSAEKLNDMSLSYYLGFAAIPVALWCGDCARSQAWIRQLDEVASRHSLAFWSALADGYRIGLERITNSVECCAGRALPCDADTLFLPNQLELLATLHPDLASTSVLAVCETRHSGWGLAEALRVKALGLPFEEAEPLLARSLDVAQQQGALSWELRSATSMADALGRTGDRKRAIGVLEPIYARFSEGFATRDLVAARSLLSRLRHGD